MTISYPLTLPAQGYAAVRLIARDVIGMAESPFTLTQQVQQHQGQRWEMDVRYPPMRDVSVIEEVLVFLHKLKGRLGTFSAMVDPLRTVRGTWVGNPNILVQGSHAANSSTISLHGIQLGATIKAGDYFQVGSRVFKALVDGTG